MRRRVKLISLFSLSLFLLGCNENISDSENYETIASDTIEESVHFETKKVTGKSYAKNGMISNTYKTGGVNELLFANINSGNDYEASSSNKYDYIIPAEAYSRKNKNVGIYFYIHGGAYIQGSRTKYSTIAENKSKEGYIVANLDYTLIDYESSKGDKTIYRILDEIRACMNDLSDVLKNEGFLTDKLSIAIEGEDAGAHLALLYALSRKDAPIDISMVVSSSAITNVEYESFVTYKDSSLRGEDITVEELEKQKEINNLVPIPYDGKTLTEYTFFTMVNILVGRPYSTLRMMQSLRSDGGFDHESETYEYLHDKYGKSLSVSTYLDSDSPSLLLGYGGLDSNMGIGHYAAIENGLVSKSVDSHYIYFPNSDYKLESDEDSRLDFEKVRKKLELKNLGY